MPVTAKRKDEITPPEDRPEVREVDAKIREVRAALEDLTDRVSEAESKAETLRNEADDLAARRIAGNDDVDGVEEAQSRAAQAEQERDDLKDAVEAHRRALERLKGRRADALGEAKQAHADEVKRRCGKLLEDVAEAGSEFLEALDRLSEFRRRHRRETRFALDQLDPYGNVAGRGRRALASSLEAAEERAERLQERPQVFAPNYIENGST